MLDIFGPFHLKKSFLSRRHACTNCGSSCKSSRPLLTLPFLFFFIFLSVQCFSLTFHRLKTPTVNRMHHSKKQWQEEKRRKNENVFFKYLPYTEQFKFFSSVTISFISTVKHRCELVPYFPGNMQICYKLRLMLLVLGVGDLSHF